MVGIIATMGKQFGFLKVTHMKNLRSALLIFLILATVQGTVFAPHDQGLGKSRDHDQDQTAADSGSIATAPEPVSGLLFLVGSGMLALRLWRKQRLG